MEHDTFYSFKSDGQIPKWYITLVTHLNQMVKGPSGT